MQDDAAVLKSTKSIDFFVSVIEMR